MYIGCSENLSLEMNRGGEEDHFDVKSLRNGGVFELRHGGASPATVPENSNSTEKKEALVCEHGEKFLTFLKKKRITNKLFFTINFHFIL
jgi:hypothetical protein